MAGLRPAFAKLLKENPIQEADQTKTEAGFIKELVRALKNLIKPFKTSLY